MLDYISSLLYLLGPKAKVKCLKLYLCFFRHLSVSILPSPESFLSTCIFVYLNLSRILNPRKSRECPDKALHCTYSLFKYRGWGEVWDSIELALSKENRVLPSVILPSLIQNHKLKLDLEKDQSAMENTSVIGWTYLPVGPQTEISLILTWDLFYQIKKGPFHQKILSVIKY